MNYYMLPHLFSGILFWKVTSYPCRGFRLFPNHNLSVQIYYRLTAESQYEEVRTL